VFGKGQKVSALNKISYCKYPHFKPLVVGSIPSISTCLKLNRDIAQLVERRKTKSEEKGESKRLAFFVYFKVGNDLAEMLHCTLVQ